MGFTWNFDISLSTSVLVNPLLIKIYLIFNSQSFLSTTWNQICMQGMLMTFLLLFGMSYTSTHWKWKWRYNPFFRLLLRWILTTQCHFWTSKFTKKISMKQWCSESRQIQENVQTATREVSSELTSIEHTKHVHPTIYFDKKLWELCKF